MGLLGEALLDHLRHAGELLLVGLHAGARVLLAGDDLHHLGGLGAAHHCGARGRPGEDEARIEAAPAHAVIAGPVGPAQHDGDLWNAGVGHGLDHFRAVLDRAVALGLGADHVAGGVL